MLQLIKNDYCKCPKYSDTQKICCNHSKIWTMWLYHRVMSPNDANGMDPDQTAPLGAVWSGSALFAQAYLSENLGPLRYHSACNSTTFTKVHVKFQRCFILFYAKFLTVITDRLRKKTAKLSMFSYDLSFCGTWFSEAVVWQNIDG